MGCGEFLKLAASGATEGERRGLWTAANASLDCGLEDG